MTLTTSEPIRFTGNGYGVEPCPGRCGRQLRPGDVRITVPGEWRSWHAACYESQHHPAPQCPYCDESHALPHDGSCLL